MNGMSMSDLPTAGELESELEVELQKLQTQQSVDSLGILSNNF